MRRLLVAAPLTVTRSSELSASSTAVIVTSPVLAVAPSAMVSTLVELSVKSPSTVLLPDAGAADTVIVVTSPDGRSSLAVTVETLPAPVSLITAGVSTSVATGAGSSSVIVPYRPLLPGLVENAEVSDGWNVAFTGEEKPAETVSSPSSTLSPFTVTSNVSVVSPAWKVTVVEDTCT